jgi:hypothetical protein
LRSLAAKRPGKPGGQQDNGTNPAQNITTVKPGVGFNPDPNDRDWGLEFGFRVQF